MTRDFIIIGILYIVILYLNHEKIKNNEIEMVRFKDQIVRFTFLQIAFSVYDIIQNKFLFSSFLYKLMITHIGVASFNVFKDYLNFIKI